jgi:hypothetical protein
MKANQPIVKTRSSRADKARTAAAIKRLRGILKRKLGAGHRPFSEGWAERKKRERDLEDRLQTLTK